MWNMNNCKYAENGNLQIKIEEVYVSRVCAVHFTFRASGSPGEGGGGGIYVFFLKIKIFNSYFPALTIRLHPHIFTELLPRDCPHTQKFIVNILFDIYLLLVFERLKFTILASGK